MPLVPRVQSTTVAPGCRSSCIILAVIKPAAKKVAVAAIDLQVQLQIREEHHYLVKVPT